MASQQIVSVLSGLRRQQTQIVHDGPGGPDAGRDLHREGETTTSVDAAQLPVWFVALDETTARFFLCLATFLVSVGGAREHMGATSVHFSI